MTLIAAGMSHRTAPVEERERFALAAHELPAALSRFREAFGPNVILSTCNRTEIYVHLPGASEVEPRELLQELAAIKGLGRNAALPDFYGLRGREAPAHLFRVAAGVDSMILGESEVLGQVRGALSHAHEAASLDAALSRLLHDALRTGRRARHETHIGRFAVSVSSAAVHLARREAPDFARCQALVVGAGEAGKLAARALRDHGVTNIAVTSRTLERAQELAEYLEGQVVPFGSLPEAIRRADLVLTSSSAPGYLIDPALVARARNGRTAPLTFMDVAVPRDVDPAVADLPGVRVFDIDDLQATSDANLRRRETAAAEVAAIVENAADAYDVWLDERRAVPTIKAIVSRAEQLRRAELERTMAELGLDAGAEEKLDRMTAAIVKKILHDPIQYLRGAEDTEASAQAVRRIFSIEDD